MLSSQSNVDLGTVMLSMKSHFDELACSVDGVFPLGDGEVVIAVCFIGEVEGLLHEKVRAREIFVDILLADALLHKVNFHTLVVQYGNDAFERSLATLKFVASPLAGCQAFDGGDAADAKISAFPTWDTEFYSGDELGVD